MSGDRVNIAMDIFTWRGQHYRKLSCVVDAAALLELDADHSHTPPGLRRKNVLTADFYSTGITIIDSVRWHNLQGTERDLVILSCFVLMLPFLKLFRVYCFSWGGCLLYIVEGLLLLAYRPPFKVYVQPVRSGREPCCDHTGCITCVPQFYTDGTWLFSYGVLLDSFVNSFNVFSTFCFVFCITPSPSRLHDARGRDCARVDGGGADPLDDPNE